MRRKLIGLAFLVALAAGCSQSGGADPSRNLTPTATNPAVATPTSAVLPIAFPADEAPHTNTTEWWYYTGHMFDAAGNRYGFEFVFFQVRQGNLAAYYASHFALTDNPAGAFSYAQKSGFNAALDVDTGFHLQLDDWQLRGAGGRDELRASMAGYALDLTLTDDDEPILHNQGSGYMDIAAAGGSYYYSRPGMELTGVLTLDGQPVEVTGTAWMDHQWGDFVLIDGGGWDWFAVQLDDGTALMVFQLRGTEETGDIPDFGTLVEPDGNVTHLAEGDYALTSQESWTSPATGATYPIDWTLSIPSRALTLELAASLPDQELDTTATTGTVYWEGEVVVTGTRGDDEVAGLGYIELTGYAADDLITP